MFCSVKASACFDTSVPAPGTDVIDFVAASKNMPKACSAWSIVFSAKSRNSAGTSSFGSIMVTLLPFFLIITFIAPRSSGRARATPASGGPLSVGKRGTKCNSGATLGSGQRVFGEGFVGGEVFDELDDLETLPRRELEKRTQQAQAFDSAGCRRAELEVQFSHEIHVFHRAPMTRIGLRDLT